MQFTFSKRNKYCNKLQAITYQILNCQSLGQKNNSKGGNSPSISITPLPGRNNPGVAKKPSVSASASNSMKPGQPGQGQGGKGNFVICEICDGYIKDLEQLRNHMQWIHKVYIVLL